MSACFHHGSLGFGAGSAAKETARLRENPAKPLTKSFLFILRIGKPTPFHCSLVVPLLGRRLLSWDSVTTTEVKPEMRVGPCSIDLEGYLCTGAILLEIFVDWHQQHALPATDHARHRGLHIGSSGEV